MLRWGIIGCGKIAQHFAKDLKLLKGHCLQAVASRSLDKAQAFAEQHLALRSYGEYNLLFQDAEVDVVYIATPHNSHMEWAIAAMQHKKHVLCEKPLAVNESQVKAMIAAAQANKVFLMEALWSRFIPTIKAVKQKCEQGDLGEIKHLYSEFSFLSDHPAESRLFNLELAGGALLDVGIYPVFLSYLLLGYPKEIKVVAELGPTGVDVQSSISLRYSNSQASLFCGLKCDVENHSVITGTKGRIRIPNRWHEAQGYIEKIGAAEEVHHKLPTKGRGYTYEIEEVGNCLSKGWLESPYWSHEDSLQVGRMLDELRRQIGLKYPFE